MAPIVRAQLVMGLAGWAHTLLIKVGRWISYNGKFLSALIKLTEQLNL